MQEYHSCTIAQVELTDYPPFLIYELIAFLVYAIPKDLQVE